MDSTTTAGRPRIFISYSHADEAWKERLVAHLRVLELEGRLVVWDTGQIHAGEERLERIEDAIDEAWVALLLISVHFLTSDLILATQIPQILDRRKADGLRIIPVIVGPCAWQRVEWLASIESRPRQGDLLSLDPAQAEQVLAALAEEVDDLLEHAEQEEDKPEAGPDPESRRHDPDATHTDVRTGAKETEGSASFRASATLDLSGTWKRRAQEILHIPSRFEAPAPALELIDQHRRQTRNGNDLYFLEMAVFHVVRRWPGARPDADRLRLRFFDHIEPPPAGLFTEIDSPRDGLLPLWSEVSPSSFPMGSPQNEGRANEQPQHRVTFKRPFRISRVPITYRQYRAFSPDHRLPPGIPTREVDDHPLGQISWYAAAAFCRWLSLIFPETYGGARLPSEQEWEHACRAGTSTRYWHGDAESDLAQVGWYIANSDDRTHRVAEKPANPWGLYDTHGNVTEWTSSVYEAAAYLGRAEGHLGDSPDASDLTLAELYADEPMTQETKRVVRGGGYWSGAEAARSAYRTGEVPSSENLNLGFRVVVPVRSAPD